MFQSLAKPRKSLVEENFYHKEEDFYLVISRNKSCLSYFPTIILFSRVPLKSRRKINTLVAAPFAKRLTPHARKGLLPLYLQIYWPNTPTGSDCIFPRALHDRVWQQIKIGRRIGGWFEANRLTKSSVEQGDLYVYDKQDQRKPTTSRSSLQPPPSTLPVTPTREQGAAIYHFENIRRRRVVSGRRARKQRGGRWWNSYGGIMDGLGWYGKHEASSQGGEFFYPEFAEFSLLEGCLFSGGLFRTWSV